MLADLIAAFRAAYNPCCLELAMPSQQKLDIHNCAVFLSRSQSDFISLCGQIHHKNNVTEADLTLIRSYLQDMERWAKEIRISMGIEKKEGAQ